MGGDLEFSPVATASEGVTNSRREPGRQVAYGLRASDYFDSGSDRSAAARDR